MNPNIARIRHMKAHQSCSSRSSCSESRKVNVGESERYASMIGGSFLAFCGLARGSLSGLALAAIGAGFICRGVTGHCQVYETLGQNTAEPKKKKESRQPQFVGV